MEEEKEKGPVKAKGVKITTSYPVLQGPSDAKFEFSLEVDSKLEKDAVFGLFAQGPEGWVINFKPAFETKYISSVRLKANQTTTVAVEVKPVPMAKAGEYPFNIRVSSDDAKAEAKLTVVLTGAYQLEVGTLTGLLSLDAGQGKPANMSFYVKNTGSAVNNNIKFMSFKLENWKVAFNPENIAAIQPGGLKQVEVTITPYEEALVGGQEQKIGRLFLGISDIAYVIILVGFNLPKSMKSLIIQNHGVGWRRGISPPRSHSSVLEPLDSHGSCQPFA